MKRFLPLALIALVGCNVSKPGGGATTDKPATVSQDKDPGVVSPAAGGISPVTNPGAVQGAGSGVGQAMKDRARGVAGNQPQIPSPDTE